MRDFGCAIDRLEIEWDVDGFFGQLRNGVYNAERAIDILELLKSLNSEGESSLPKRLVALLWYMPCFLAWQMDRVIENRGDITGYKQSTTEVHNVLEQFLGTP